MVVDLPDLICHSVIPWLGQWLVGCYTLGFVGHRTPPTKFPSLLDDCSNSVIVIVIVFFFFGGCWLHRAGCFKNLLDGMFVASCWFAINAILLSELAQKLAC